MQMYCEKIDEKAPLQNFQNEYRWWYKMEKESLIFAAKTKVTFQLFYNGNLFIAIQKQETKS